MTRKHGLYFGGILSTIWVSVLVLVPTVSHAKSIGSLPPEVRLFTNGGSEIRRVEAYAPSFRGGIDVVTGDVDGDGTVEIVTGAGAGGGPEIRVFTLEGILVSRFFAYGRGFRGGVNVAAYDLDGDGPAEIITGPGLGGGPEVRVFRRDGTLLARFLAYDRGFRGGVNVAAGPFGNRGSALIVTGSGYGGSHVRAFTPSGKYAGVSLRPFPNAIFGVEVASLNDPGQRAKLVVTPARSSRALVKIFDLGRDARRERSFYGFGKTYEGGARIATADVDRDGKTEIIVGSGPGKSSLVRVFNADGGLERQFRPYPVTFRGGVGVAAAPGAILTSPGAVDVDGRADLYKYIHIDLSEQYLRFYENGRLIGAHRVSTGKWDMPTPIGTFAIKNHIPNAYSKRYDLYMEWWMAFSPDGSYGIHALPYWLNKQTGAKRYEGIGHLGTPVSHGCIRQTLKEAKHLYDWAENGTPVIVER